MEDAEAAEHVRTSHFSDVNRFSLGAHQPGPQFIKKHKRLESSEVSAANHKLKNRRALGFDNLCAGLLNHAPPELQIFTTKLWRQKRI